MDLIATGKEAETFSGLIDEIRPSMDIAPSQDKTISATVVSGIPASDVKLVKEQAAAIFLWGVVEYFDVFGQKQTTAFRRMSDKFPTENHPGIKIDPIKFFMCDEGNEAT